MAVFKTNDIQLADKIRREHGISPVEAIRGDYLQPKTYVYAQSEEEIKALLAGEPVSVKLEETPKEKYEVKFLKSRRRNKNQQ